MPEALGDASPQRGSIRRAEGEDRGSGTLPAGNVCGRSDEVGASAHSLADVVEAISIRAIVTVTVSMRPHRTREGAIFNLLILLVRLGGGMQ